MQVTIKKRQSLLDIAVQEMGSLEEALSLSIENDLSVSEDLEEGRPIEYRGKHTITGVLSAKGVRPATAVSEEDQALVPYGGIGYMSIEVDFIVS
ncbi:MAG: hypothetical protein LUE98_07795 [Tannerellaceae bacterium]|nr:hypothetical protein [Tannerellaceae bacterium]